MTEQEKIIATKRAEIIASYNRLIPSATRICEGKCSCHDGCCLPPNHYCAYGSLNRGLANAKALTDDDILAMIDAENAPPSSVEGDD